jgi:hypothetical protein
MGKANNSAHDKHVDHSGAVQALVRSQKATDIARIFVIRLPAGGELKIEDLPTCLNSDSMGKRKT